MSLLCLFSIRWESSFWRHSTVLRCATNMARQAPPELQCVVYSIVCFFRDLFCGYFPYCIFSHCLAHSLNSRQLGLPLQSILPAITTRKAPSPGVYASASKIRKNTAASIFMYRTTGFSLLATGATLLFVEMRSSLRGVKVCPCSADSTNLHVTAIFF